MNLIKKVAIFVVSLLILCTNYVPVFAAEEIHYDASLVFGPPTQRIMLEAGQTYRSSVYISNPSDSVKATKYILYVTPYGVSNENYNPVFDQKNTYTQIVDWITLDKTEGILQPGEKEDIGFTVNVPVNAPAGGQYATIMAQDTTNLDSNKEDGGLSISSITAIGAIVYASVDGETKKEGVILENNIPSILFSSPLEATSRIKNSGNVHTDAEYVLQVWPLFSDAEICTNEEDPKTILAMPETELYHKETCDLPPVGIFRAKQTIKFFGETSIVEKMIFICPLWLLFIIIFAFIMIIMWFVVRTKKRNKTTKS